MQGAFLHILGWFSSLLWQNYLIRPQWQFSISFEIHFWKPFPADTLGSVGVIISTLLMDNFGWQRADPIASIFIAIMTLISVKPLLTETTQVLLQRSPAELDSKLPQIYQQLATIGLVTNISEIMNSVPLKIYLVQCVLIKIS